MMVVSLSGFVDAGSLLSPLTNFHVLCNRLAGTTLGDEGDAVVARVVLCVERETGRLPRDSRALVQLKGDTVAGA